MAVILDMVIQIGIMENNLKHINRNKYGERITKEEIINHTDGFIHHLNKTLKQYVNVDPEDDHRCPLCIFDAQFWNNCYMCPWLFFMDVGCIRQTKRMHPTISEINWSIVKELSRGERLPKNPKEVFYLVIARKRISTIKFWIDCLEYYRKGY